MLAVDVDGDTVGAAPDPTLLPGGSGTASPSLTPSRSVSSVGLASCSWAHGDDDSSAAAEADKSMGVKGRPA